MTEDEKWQFILDLDDELLLGSVILSEWATFLIKDSDLAFVHGANLACIITAMAAAETHLRYLNGKGRKQRFIELIESAVIDKTLRTELNILRKYRNRWVHIDDPYNDGQLLCSPSRYESELQEMAKRAVVALRRVVYSEQGM